MFYRTVSGLSAVLAMLGLHACYQSVESLGSDELPPDDDATTPDATSEGVMGDGEDRDDTKEPPCVGESDPQFCERLGKDCGPVSAPDNCGADRQAECGSCTGDEVCGALSAGVCAVPPCVAEDDDAFCARLGKDCNGVSDKDNCNAERTADCGTCTGIEICGASTANVCGAPPCVPESDSDFCQQLGKDCDGVTARDNCAQTRSVDCGTCSGAEVCGATSPNVCGEPPCVGESNPAFCARLGKDCGSVTSVDNCGTARTTACGTCNGSEICGASTANVCGEPPCVPETDELLCQRLGKDCGALPADDNCDVRRTAECGTCSDPEVCGANTANVCGCRAETNTAFCSRLGKNCGSVSALDNCGADRTATCGTCTGGNICGPTLENVCGPRPCVSESDDTFCSRLGKDCGSLTANDNCGVSRTRDCGSCSDPETCGAISANVCGCVVETNAAFCGRLGKDCGSVTALNNCGVNRTISCGSCTGTKQCGAITANVCGCLGETNATFCARLGKDCGSVSAPDNCGVSRSATCGSCSGDAICGVASPNVCGPPPCVAESDATFCGRLNKECGPVTASDNCGASRTASCGSCSGAEVCGAITVNVCDAPPVCVAETNNAFCSRLGKNCNSVTAADNCGANRTTSCGSCTGGAICGAVSANVCGPQPCSAETNVAFCTRLSKQCGSVTAADNCGTPRTVGSCGVCPNNGVCTPGGSCLGECGDLGAIGCCDATTAFWCEGDDVRFERCDPTEGCDAYASVSGYRCNEADLPASATDPDSCGQYLFNAPCASESDAEFCTRLDQACGPVTDDDNCGVSRTITCGLCACGTLDSVGCCDGSTNYWCGGNTVASAGCGTVDNCGWSAVDSYYSCGFQGEDPSTTNPISCDGFAFQFDLDACDQYPCGAGAECVDVFGGPANASGRKCVCASDTLLNANDGCDPSVLEPIGWGDSPVVVEPLVGAVAVAAGRAYVVAVRGDGTIVAWGTNVLGQFGRLHKQSGVRAVSANWLHTLLLMQDGTVAVFGANWNDQNSVASGLVGVAEVAAGSNHSVALLSSGTVVAWGENAFGQTSVPNNLTNVKSIAAGASHTIALRQDGTIKVWGANWNGQNAVGEALTGVAAVAAGYEHSVALLADGTVTAWGTNTFAQTSVPGGLTNVKAVAAAGWNSVALKHDGTVVVWGDDSYGQLTVPAGLSNVVAVAASDLNIVALVADGSVVVWGDERNGLARIPSGPWTATAVDAGWGHSVALLRDGTVVAWGRDEEGQASVPNGLSKVTAISAGLWHTVALQQDGTVVAWGSNSNSQSDVPDDLTNVKSVSAGALHNVALKYDGTLTGWGYDGDGEVSGGIGLTNVKAVGAGLYHTMALKNDGTVVAWGYNQMGQTSVPGGLTNVSAVAAGAHHSMALREDGTVAVWGADWNGQIAVAAGLVDIVAIAAGDQHSVALRSDGTVVAFGNNGNLQATVPSGLSNVVAIAAGGLHSLALKANGEVVAWGGQFTGETDVPSGIVSVSAGSENAVAVRQDGAILQWGAAAPADASDLVATASGVAHTLGLKKDGTVVAWGDNGNGQTDVPAGLSSVRALAAGGAHSVALKHDGTVVVWGSNDQGQRNVPNGLSGVVAIAAGREHTLALEKDGTVVAWGDNVYGQRIVPGGLANVVAIAAGYFHSLALEQDGTITAWGANENLESTVPPGLANVVGMAAGWDHTVALKQDGTLVSWGLNDQGETIAPDGLANVVAIAAGGEQTIAVRRVRRAPAPTVDGWGGENYGPFGATRLVLGTSFERVLAVRIAGHIVRWKVLSPSQIEITLPHVSLNGVVEVVTVSGTAQGVFEFSVHEPDCETHADCADPKPLCHPDALRCVGCVSDFDCAVAGPACLGDHLVASCGIVDVCTGDDGAEHADDGPAGATLVSLPDAFLSRKICGAWDGDESDYFKLSLGAGEVVRIAVQWSTPADLDFKIYDAEGNTLSSGSSGSSDNEILTFTASDAGDYYLDLAIWTGPTTEAMDYTLDTTACDQTDFAGEANMTYNPSSGYVAFGLADATNDLTIEFYDFGGGSPLTGPGDYPLGDNPADQNYATCSTCAIIHANSKVFFATEGLVTVTELDQVGRIVKATLSNALLVEVTIDQQTFVSTPVPNGETWCITRLAVEYEAECTSDANCSDPTPFCDTGTFECVSCLGSLHCTADNPVCDGGACIEGYSICDGDDANENSDDGPLGANPIALDGADATGKICGVDGEPSGDELDYYTFTLAAESHIEAILTWTGAQLDFDLYFLNDALEAVSSSGASSSNPEVMRALNLAAGTYYLVVNSYAGAPEVAVDYTLSLATLTPECTQDADCTDVAKPACDLDLDSLTCVACTSNLHCASATPVCGAGGALNACGVIDFCDGDDGDVHEHADDGINGATTVTFPTAPIVQLICGDAAAPSAAESDYFKVAIPAGGSLDVKLEWTGAGVDLDVLVVDDTGARVDEAATVANPEELTISGVAAGDYYVVVYSYEGAATTAVAYTLTLTLSPPGYSYIPAGTFTMGSPISEPDRGSDETQHEVTLTRAFWMKQTEVTQGEWQTLMGNNPSLFQGPSYPDAVNRPVEMVSWWDALAFANLMSSNAGLSSCYTLTGCSGTPGGGNYECTDATFAGAGCTGYRLPTESEWEYAARAGTTGARYAEPPGDVAWSSENSGAQTHAVAGKLANAWGLFDMLGNVWEWTWDWYGTYPGAVTDPTGAATGALRAARGATYNFDATFARSAKRAAGTPFGNLGFRLVRSVP